MTISHKKRSRLPRLGRVMIMALVVAGLCGNPGWAGVDIQTEESSFGLEDGSSLEMTDDAIILYELTDDGQERRIRWSVPTEDAHDNLFFETPAHGQCLLYLTPEPNKQIGLHALRLDDGHPLWDSNIMIGATLDQPVKPVFVAPWIYWGRGTWLERLNPEDGTIVQRFPMREIIQELYVLTDNSLEVVVETFDAGQLSDHFRDGRWFPHITASSSLSGSSLLMNRAIAVMPDFAGTLAPSEYQGYLDLHRIKKKIVSPENIVMLRNFNVAEAENAYRHAGDRDLANPYLALFLALAHYYQGQRQAAATAIDDALHRSAEFWEESIRLGAICESLGHTAWADAFYGQGMALYFQEVPAPAQEVTLDEVLALFLQQQSSTLFAAGHPDRALHVQDIRRQMFPYTEGDNHFSRHYAAWLKQNGQAELAQQEQQRIGKRTLIFDMLTITPFSFWNFGGLATLFLLFIILKNDIRHWSELLVCIAILFLVDSVATMDLLGTPNLPIRTLAHVGGLGGYVALITWLRHRRTRPSAPFHNTLAVVTMSSYVVLLRGTLPAYYAGFQLTHSQVWAKWTEILFVVVFLGIYLVCRHRLSTPPILRYGRLLVLGLIVSACWIVWLYQWGRLGIIMENFPKPWADKGHPNWVAYIDKRVADADFRKEEMQFLQALVYHMRGDTEYAEQLYEPLTQDARALNNLGVLVSGQDRDAANSYFQRALQQDAEFQPAQYNLGVLAGDRQAIEQPLTPDAWLPAMYQRHAPERLWIANPDLEEWCRTLYWSRGGFLYKSFLESMVRLTNPAELFQEDLQQLR